jgi:hypothetical protein
MTNFLALEMSWWKADPSHTETIPPSSMLGLTDLPGTSLNPDIIPRKCLVQIGSIKLCLPARWRPLLMVIQLMQMSALVGWRQACRTKTVLNRDPLRIVWFYDAVLVQFAKEGWEKENEMPPNSCLPMDWMPETMHRCLTRMEMAQPHSPAMLSRLSEALRFALESAYNDHRDHFTSGM